MNCPHLRKDLPPLTNRIAALPVDARGYPVPFFVQWLDGQPEFRLMDPMKKVRCTKDSLCWVCGQPLGAYKSFVIGPMCSVNRISSEPPSHRECAEWSVKGCPFLSKPGMVRREDELTESMKSNVPGEMIGRNPGVSLVWTTTTFTLIRVHNGYLFNLGSPLSLSCWREGRAATKDEIFASIESGLSLLREACDKERTEAGQKEAHQDLTKAVESAMALLKGFILRATTPEHRIPLFEEPPKQPR